MESRKNVCEKSKPVSKKPRGPFSMEKCQHEFDQIKASKMKQINLFQDFCTLCHSTFDTVTESDIHVRKKDCLKRNFREKASGVTHSCDSCNVSFDTKKKYLSHCQSSHPTYEYKCHECDKSFTIRSSWQRHKVEVHESEKFQCTSCSFQSKRAFSNMISIGYFLT